VAGSHNRIVPSPPDASSVRPFAPEVDSQNDALLLARRHIGEHRVEPGTEARHQVQDVIYRDQGEVSIVHEYLAVLMEAMLRYSQRFNFLQD
jgi:hypothetical protein